MQIKMRCRAAFFCMALSAGDSELKAETLAANPKAITSKILLITGVPMGLGGGPQLGFDIISVCDDKNINEQLLSLAMVSSLNELNLSPDPPSVDIISEIRPDKEWLTLPALISEAEIEDYNGYAQKFTFLPTDQKLYKKYRGVISLEDQVVFFTTVVNILQGTSSEALNNYRGDYDGRFFHDKILESFASRLKSYSCDK